MSSRGQARITFMPFLCSKQKGHKRNKEKINYSCTENISLVSSDFISDSGAVLTRAGTVCVNACVVMTLV